MSLDTMSPATRFMLEAHVAAIRNWHRCKGAADQRGDNSTLVAQGMMKATAKAFALADAADRGIEAARFAKELSDEVPIEERTGE